jgi:hypothetical protein
LFNWVLKKQNKISNYILQVTLKYDEGFKTVMNCDAFHYPSASEEERGCEEPAYSVALADRSACQQALFRGNVGGGLRIII